MLLNSFLRKAGVAALILALVGAQSAQMAQAASSTIVVAPTPTPVDCGKYKTAQSTDLAATLNSAKKGKVLICPGSYLLAGDVMIDNAHGLTIAQAANVKGQDNRPRIIVDNQTPTGIYVKDSSAVTINGIVLDGHANTADGYQGITIDHTSATILNTLVIGSPTTDTGISVLNLHDKKTWPLTVKDSFVMGYTGFGISAIGPLRVNVSASWFDATNNFVIPAPSAVGVAYLGDSGDPIPTGSVSGSFFFNNDVGVLIRETNKVRVSKNDLESNRVAIQIDSQEVSHVTSSNSVSGNSISHVPANGVGVLVSSAFDPADFPMLNNVVTHNTIVSAAPDSDGIGVEFASNFPAARTMTGAVTANTISGFKLGNAILNTAGFAGVTIKNNIVN